MQETNVLTSQKMDINIQGLIMKTLSLKALSRLLFTCCLIFASQLSFAEDKVAAESAIEQQVVYLNNSTAEQLASLKGIGLKKAAAIIAYREQFGPFKSITDLTKIKGIGGKVVLDNKSRLKI